jgi:hypothetical protein
MDGGWTTEEACRLLAASSILDPSKTLEWTGADWRREAQRERESE